MECPNCHYVFKDPARVAGGKAVKTRYISPKQQARMQQGRRDKKEAAAEIRSEVLLKKLMSRFNK
jgi:hypothetical protein